jgi:hypothetical protein
MAAATPSRPFVCVVPNRQVIELASELRGLGGTDVALAQVIAYQSLSKNCVEELAFWAQDGFSATVLPFSDGSDAAQVDKLLKGVAQATAEVFDLAVSWVVVGKSRAANLLGSSVSPATPLRDGPAVAAATAQEVSALVHLALKQLQDASPGHHLIISLHTLNPGDGTLATLSCIVAAGGDERLALLELVGDVAELHAQRREGVAMQLMLRCCDPRLCALHWTSSRCLPLHTVPGRRPHPAQRPADPAQPARRAACSRQHAAGDRGGAASRRWTAAGGC